MKLALLILLIVSFLFIGNADADNSAVYISLVDGYNGFSRIINTVGEYPLYENHTFNIVRSPPPLVEVVPS